MQAAEAGAPEKGVLRVATWNIAAINNNPFEYWITHDDADYNRSRPGLGCWYGVGVRVVGEYGTPLTAMYDHVLWQARLMEGVQLAPTLTLTPGRACS